MRSGYSYPVCLTVKTQNTVEIGRKRFGEFNILVRWLFVFQLFLLFHCHIKQRISIDQLMAG